MSYLLKTALRITDKDAGFNNFTNKIDDLNYIVRLKLKKAGHWLSLFITLLY
ncbi:hypothetical protein FC49_GL001715 [Limosilactobacillus oris DSM 4864]|uniref:Uncharacterized protein n=1 Tax=Limosilactobacillus oris DSM 4864 TaxID=1423779 RepID=A0A0R1WDN9_9LACO|nr:hypothetical protein FC49_GL001715 [Limosilactobacillus oris DSM 4864]